jgi:nucleoside-diphosphate-sugar epimerase
MKKKYLITGGTGFIGSNIVNRLLLRGHKIIVFDNNQRGKKNRLIKNKNLSFVFGDIRNFNDILKASKKVDGIIHCAYVNGTETFYKKPELILEIAILGIINILNVVKKVKIKEFYLLSSSEVYQLPKKIPTPEDVPLIIPDVLNPRFSYGGGKIISEMISIHSIKKYVDKVIIVRPHNVYGPDMGTKHVIPQIIKKIKYSSKNFKKNKIKFEIQGTGNETRAFTYIDDFVDGLILLIENKLKHGIYHIGDNREIKIISVINKILDILNISAVIKKRKLLKGSVLRRCPNINKIKRLGFKPKTNLNTGLTFCVNWYSKN